MSAPAPTVLLVAAGAQSPLARHMFGMYAAEARRRGVRLHQTDSAVQLAAGPPAAPVDASEPLDFTDLDGCLSWARRQVADGKRFDVVFSGREDAQLATAHLAEALGAPGNPPDAVRTVRNKDLCRERLRAEGFAQPTVTLCRDAGDAAAALDRTPGPWVVKPRDASGSAGVSLVRSPDELPEALVRVGDHRPFLVETFVDGAEYSAEGVFVDGVPRVLGITAKEVAAPPGFFEVGQVLPAPLPERVTARMGEEVSAALTALRLRHGIFHVELWLTGQGVVLGEVHVRPAGDYIHLLLAHAVPGLEVFGTLLDDALGREPLVPLAGLAVRRAAAVRYLVLPPGPVVAVEGWAETLAHPAVLHGELNVGAGDVVGPLTHSYDRAGALVVGADTPAEAERLARQLVDQVVVRQERTA